MTWMYTLPVQYPPIFPFPALPECRAIVLPSFPDVRGCLVDIVNTTTDQGVLKAYYMETIEDEGRDLDTWHIHHKQTDRFVVLRGRILFALSDGIDMVRLHLSADYPSILTIPPGVYHCFRTVGKKTSGVLGMPDRLYDGSDEGRVLFDELKLFGELKVDPPWEPRR